MHLARGVNVPVIAIVATIMGCALGGCGDGASARDGAQRAVLRGHTDVVLTLAFSGDGRTLASAGVKEQTVRLWDLRTSKPLGAPLTGYSAFKGIAFTPRGNTLVYATARRIRLFDVRRRKQIAVLKGHQDSVSEIALSGEGRILASYDDQTIRLWDLRTHRQIGAPLSPSEQSIDGVALSPDGRTLAYANERVIRLLDTRTRRELRPPLQGKNLEVGSVSFSRDARTLLSEGLYDGWRLWDTRTHKQRGAAIPGGWLTESVVISPDARSVAYTEGDVIRLMDIATRKRLGTLEGHTGDVVSLAFSPDGQTLASGGADKTVRLWDVPPGSSAN